jgi:hypothetical protein
MSARRAPRPSAAAAATATTTNNSLAHVLRAGEAHRQAARTGCSPSPYFEGRTLPCGIICSSGDAPTLGQTYIVTSRDRLGEEGRLVKPPDDDTPDWVLKLQAVLKRELHKDYAHIWTYVVGERDRPFQKDEEIRAMRAVDCTADMQAKAFGDAYDRISAACDGNLVFFRIGG